MDNAMFHFEACSTISDYGQGGHRKGGGGLVEVEGRVMWGSLDAVYKLVEQTGNWVKVTTKASEATLAVCGGRLVAIGGMDAFEKHCMMVPCCSMEVLVWDPKDWNGMGKWSHLTYVRGCLRACAVGIDGGGLVVMGGGDIGYNNNLDKKPFDSVDVFDGQEAFMHRGPSLPKPRWGMSGAVHDGVIYLMGGTLMGRSVWSANISDLVKHTDTEEVMLTVWKKLPSVPNRYSCGCVVDGVLLAIGGQKCDDDDVHDDHHDDDDDVQDDGADEPNKTSSIYAFEPTLSTWRHVGDLPFEASNVDALRLSGGDLLVVDCDSGRVVRGKKKAADKKEDTSSPSNKPSPEDDGGCGSQQKLVIEVLIKEKDEQHRQLEERYQAVMQQYEKEKTGIKEEYVKESVLKSKEDRLKILQGSLQQLEHSLVQSWQKDRSSEDVLGTSSSEGAPKKSKRAKSIAASESKKLKKRKHK